MKIKRVEIQAFKSFLYQEDSTFDFMVEMPSGEKKPANLISIYAPNGFGKTSFYDAVDFCVTNNISRYIRADRIKKLNMEHGRSNNNTGKKQYILRNKLTDDINPLLKTTIKIDSTKKTFLSNYTKPRNGYMDYKFNPDDTPEDRIFFREVMLGQESIDAFLREDSPVDRYSKFINQQVNYLSDLDDNRQKINSMLTVIKTKNDELLKHKDRLQKDLDKVNEQKDVFVEANTLIVKFFNLGFELSPIENSFSQLQKQQLDDRIKSITSSITQKDEDQKLLSQLITNFIGNFDSYKRHYQEKKRLNIEFKALSNIIDEKQVLDLNREQQQSYQNKLDLLSKEQEILNEYLKELPNFVDYQTKLVQLDKFIIEQQKKISEYKATIESNTIELKLSNQNQQNILVEKQRLSDLQTASISYYLQISDTQKLIAEYAKLIEDEVTQQITLQHIVEDINAQLKQVKSFDIAQTQLIPNEVIVSNKNELNTLNQKFHIEKSNLEKLRLQETLVQDDLTSIQQQSSAISELIRQGSAIITQTQQSDCPLCQHPYLNFIKLQAQIENNPALENAEKKLLHESNILGKLIAESKEMLTQLKSGYEKKIIYIIDSLQVQHDNKQKLLGDSLLKQEEIKKKSVRVSQELNLLLEKTLFKTSHELKEYFEKEVTLLSQKTDQFKLVIERLEVKLKEDNENKISTLHALDLLLMQQSTLTKNIEFQPLQAFFVSQSIDINSPVDKLLEILSQLQLQKQQDIADQGKILKSLVLKINELEKSIPIEYQGQAIEAIKAIQNTSEQNSIELSRKLSIHQKAASYLKADDLNDNGNEVSIKDNANEILLGLISKSETNNQQINDLQLLSKLADGALNFSNKLDLIEQISGIEKRMSDLDSVNNSLIADIKQISKYLEDSIKQYFHTDLINQLYATIDPHPDFKEIQFDCTIPEMGGKAELNITLRNPKDDSVISPTLYFSSAQINVLSLSIFLARALNVKDTDGNSVDCIFIDDPIQSMDSINVLGLIDLFRNLCSKFDKQLIISTHDQNFHELLKKKMPKGIFNAKYLELESFGKVVEQ